MSFRKGRIHVSCRKCGKKFTVKPSHRALGFGKYCSRRCSALSQMKVRITKECATCGKGVHRSPRDIKRSKSGQFFCTKRCQTLWRNSLYVGSKHGNWRHGRTAYRSILGRAKRKKVCVVCKTKDMRVLTVHHIDKDRTNNAVENLAWLCHNCHFLVHHYDVGRDLGLLKPRH